MVAGVQRAIPFNPDTEEVRHPTTGGIIKRDPSTGNQDPRILRWYETTLQGQDYNYWNPYGQRTNMSGELAPDLGALQAQESLRKKQMESLGEYKSILNPAQSAFADPSMLIKNQYDPRYQNELYQYATSTSDSPWLALTRQQIGQEKNKQLGSISAQAGAGVTNAREQLAARRGLRSGAAERLAGQGNLAMMMGRQGASQAAAGNELTAQLEEARQKLGIRSQMPGMEMERARNEQAIQTQNLANLTAERQRQQAYGLDKWKTQQQVSAAERLASQQRWAAENTGGIFGQGGFLGTGWNF